MLMSVDFELQLEVGSSSELLALRFRAEARRDEVALLVPPTLDVIIEYN